LRRAGLSVLPATRRACPAPIGIGIAHALRSPTDNFDLHVTGRFLDRRALRTVTDIGADLRQRQHMLDVRP
jgi:hypothetical protein